MILFAQFSIAKKKIMFTSGAHFGIIMTIKCMEVFSMDGETIVTTDVCVNENGKVSFAPDVVATIANLAASEVPGVSGLGGGFADSLGDILGKKNYTQGVRVEVGKEEAAIDICVSIKYGEKIQEVCCSIQSEVKKAIETMTGLRVVEVNVYVQSVTFDDEGKPDKKKGDRRNETESRVK